MEEVKIETAKEWIEARKQGKSFEEFMYEKSMKYVSGGEDAPIFGDLIAKLEEQGEVSNVLSEQDIQFNMEKYNVTREQVIEAWRKQRGGGM